MEMRAYPPLLGLQDEDELGESWKRVGRELGETAERVRGRVQMELGESGERGG